MRKVAKINISQDNCGPYILKLIGSDAQFFKIIDTDLYFLLEQPNICKTSYSVTVSIQDRIGRFTPKNVVYNLSTPFCECATTTTTTTITTSTTTSTTCPPVVYPSNIISNNATYSQSSVWSQNFPASAITMNNKSVSEEYQTGTNYSGLQWIKMDLGLTSLITHVVIGCDFYNILRTGWGKSYTENLEVEFSIDNINWTSAFNTGLFCGPIKVLRQQSLLPLA
jgi:hypothetical protein